MASAPADIPTTTGGASPQPVVTPPLTSSGLIRYPAGSVI